MLIFQFVLEVFLAFSPNSVMRLMLLRIILLGVTRKHKLACVHKQACLHSYLLQNFMMVVICCLAVDVSIQRLATLLEDVKMKFNLVFIMYLK